MNISKYRNLSLLSAGVLVLSLFITVGLALQQQENRSRAAGENWYNANWKYRKAITINASKVSGTQTNFPVLVSLTSDPDLSSRARADGFDIVFTASDGVTKLATERERYASGSLVAWVNVPSISSTANTTVYLYYGNSSSCDQSSTSCDSAKNSVAAWNSNYKAVWHMNGNPGTSAPQMKDSTTNGNNGTTQGGMSSGQLVSCKVGYCFDFYGGDDYATVPDSSSLDTLSSAMTVSLWVNADTFDAYFDRYISRNAYPSQQWFIEDVGTENGRVRFNGGSGDLDSASKITAGSWYYVTLTRTGSATILYLNGVLNKQGAGGAIGTNGNIGIAADPNGSSVLNGKIDEVRLSNVANSASWIQTEYNNQNSPTTFITTSLQETLPVPTVAPTSTPIPTATPAPTATPVPTSTPTPIPTNVPTTLPTTPPTATTAPVATTVPTTVLIPTNTPVPNGTQFSLNLLLHGIGKGGDSSNAQSQGNMSPLHAQRTVTVDIYNSQDQLVVTKEGIVNFNPVLGNFTGTVDLGNAFVSGVYTVRVKSNQFLRALVPGIQTVTQGTVVSLPQTTLITGDVNNDNLVNILDYNILMGCYSDFLPAVSCTPANKLLADITDDGNVNQFDYNLFIRELNTRGGQ